MPNDTLNLALPPGIFGSGTEYQSSGRWRKAQLMRFRENTIRPVGGWTGLVASGGMLYVPMVKAADGSWVFLSGGVPDGEFVSVGDGELILLESGSPTAVRWAFRTADGSIIFQGAGAGEVIRSLVGWRMSGATGPTLAIGSNATLKTFTAGAVVDRTPGALVPGNIDATSSLGAFGAGDYGSGAYGVGDSAQALPVDPSIWRLDTFGDYLVGVLSPSDGVLWVWDGLTDTMVDTETFASSRSIFCAAGTYTVSASHLADGDTVVIGSKTYTFKNTVGATDGYVYLPTGGTDTQDLAAVVNLILAINLTGTAGTSYGTNTTKHTLVKAAAGATTREVLVTALLAGVAGNAIAFSATGTAGGVDAATLGTTVAGQAVATPQGNMGVVVTPERFAMLLGADGDPRRIAFASQETLWDWTAVETNTAGGLQLPGSGRIICGRRTKNETLIFTDEDAFAVSYIGGTLVYGLQEIGSKCGIVGPNAVAVVDSRAAWMGPAGFWLYDGAVRPAPSEVNDLVFRNMNPTQRAKCFAMPMASLGEVWFFYPSMLSDEPDSYVIWNFLENHWTPGKLLRTAGIDRGVFDYPIMAMMQALYQHENGTDHAGADAPFLESGPLELTRFSMGSYSLSKGDVVMNIMQLVPDEATQAGQQLGSTQLWLYAKFYPDGPEYGNTLDAEGHRVYGPFQMASPTPLRVAARQIRIRVEEIVPGDWCLGVIRLTAVPGGMR